jgi:hypothetical protein
MKTINLIFALILLVNFSFAQISKNGKTGSYSPQTYNNNPPLGYSEGRIHAYVHEFYTDYNIKMDFPTFTNPYALSQSAYINCGDFGSDHFMYGANFFWGSGSLTKTDIRTGTTTVVGAITFPNSDEYTAGMAFDPTNNIMYVITGIWPNQSFLYKISLTDASTTFIKSYSGIGFQTLAFNKQNGLLYTINDLDDCLYTLLPSNGTSTKIGAVGFDMDGFFCDADFNESTNELYASHYDGFNTYISKIDPATGSSMVQATRSNADFIVFAFTSNPALVPVSYWVIGALFVLLALGILIRKRLF